MIDGWLASRRAAAGGFVFAGRVHGIGRLSRGVADRPHDLDQEAEPLLDLTADRERRAEGSEA